MGKKTHSDKACCEMHSNGSPQAVSKPIAIPDDKTRKPMAHATYFESVYTLWKRQSKKEAIEPPSENKPNL